ncbi:MAG: hypothetical protein LIP23_10350 [Planctomycetes bacterium]|nr:hypothetical protein [Planctomycetota bacterium]
MSHSVITGADNILSIFLGILSSISIISITERSFSVKGVYYFFAFWFVNVMDGWTLRKRLFLPAMAAAGIAMTALVLSRINQAGRCFSENRDGGGFGTCVILVNMYHICIAVSGEGLAVVVNEMLRALLRNWQ